MVKGRDYQDIQIGIKMAYFMGVELPDDGKIINALTKIYGIGRSSAEDIVSKADLDPSMLVKDLSGDDLFTLRSIISAEYTVGGDLKAEVREYIRRKKEIFKK